MTNQNQDDPLALFRSLEDCLREDCQEQVVEIEKHKWIESEKAGRDLGEDAVRDWITRFAAEWRAHRESRLRLS